MLTHELAPRDREVIKLIGILSQASSAHIKDMVFPDVNRISMDRALKRLAREEYVRRVGRRMPGPLGGNSPSVYRLGKKGWWHVGRDDPNPGVRAVNEHSLLLADVYVRLELLERAGLIVIFERRLEYHVGDGRADMYLDIGIRARQWRGKYYLEAQRNARSDAIKPKLDQYGREFSSTRLDPWPLLVFMVWDTDHKRGISRLVPKDSAEWVRVYMLDEFFADEF